MGSVIEIHVATLDELVVEGIARDIIEFLKQYDLTKGVTYAEVHHRHVIK